MLHNMRHKTYNKSDITCDIKKKTYNKCDITCDIKLIISDIKLIIKVIQPVT